MNVDAITPGVTAIETTRGVTLCDYVAKQR